MLTCAKCYLNFQTHHFFNDDTSKFKRSIKTQPRKCPILSDLNRVYTLHDLVTADVIFAATGVTQGSILNGIRREPGWVTLETILMRSKTGSVRRIEYRSPVK